MEVFELIMDNLDGIAAVIMSIITMASIITAGTKTPAQGTSLAKAYMLVEYLALVNKKTKQQGIPIPKPDAPEVTRQEIKRPPIAGRRGR